MHFEQSIGEILKVIKCSLSELADTVRDKVSQYLSASEVLPSGSMQTLLRKTSVVLEECLKSQERRNDLKRRINMISKELADIKFRSPSKHLAEKDKLEKQLKSKFDINTTEMNMLMNQFSVFFRDSFEGAKHYQSMVNGMVLVGFDKLAHVYREWGSKLSTQIFPKASETQSSIAILEVSLEGIPTSWMSYPPQELNFDQYTQALEQKRVQSSNTAVVESIAISCQRHKESLRKADSAKVDIYVLHLMSPRLTEAEEALLDNEISFKLDQDAFVSYFLLTLNFQLVALGKQNHKISKRSFIGLKNKFLMMMSSRLLSQCRHRSGRRQDEQHQHPHLQRG